MNRSTCILFSIEKVFGLLLLSTILTTLVAQNIGSSSTAPTLVHGGPSVSAPTNCTAVRSHFIERGINNADIPNAPNNGECFFFFFFHFMFLPK